MENHQKKRRAGPQRHNRAFSVWGNFVKICQHIWERKITLVFFLAVVIFHLKNILHLVNEFLQSFVVVKLSIHIVIPKPLNHATDIKKKILTKKNIVEIF